MSYRVLQLFPHTSTREARLRIVARGPGGALLETFQNVSTLLFWSRDAVDLGFEADEDTEERSNWDLFLGFLVVLAVSGGFWTGLGLLIARLVR